MNEKNDPQFDQKSTKQRPNNDQKSTKINENGVGIGSKTILEAFVSRKAYFEPCHEILEPLSATWLILDDF